MRETYELTNLNTKCHMEEHCTLARNCGLDVIPLTWERSVHWELVAKCPSDVLMRNEAFVF